MGPQRTGLNVVAASAQSLSGGQQRAVNGSALSPRNGATSQCSIDQLVKYALKVSTLNRQCQPRSGTTAALWRRHLPYGRLRGLSSRDQSISSHPPGDLQCTVGSFAILAADPPGCPAGTSTSHRLGIVSAQRLPGASIDRRSGLSTHVTSSSHQPMRSRSIRGKCTDPPGASIDRRSVAQRSRLQQLSVTRLHSLRGPAAADWSGRKHDHAGRKLDHPAGTKPMHTLRLPSGQSLRLDHCLCLRGV